MGNMTRKAFVVTAVSAAGLITFGSTAKAFANEEIIRPPVVLDEAEFTSKCLRCYRCIEVCHTHALIPAPLEDGVLAMHTPKFDFHKGLCDFCNACVDACPTEAIHRADPESPSTGRIGIAVVQTDRCVAYWNGCQECYQHCPYGAISLSESGYPLVDESICNGCGVCENICPALVYRSFSGGNRRGIVVVRNEAAVQRMKTSMKEWSDSDA